ncbi:MAG: acyl carrier protein [Kiritimatiellia bacterium]
MEEETKKVQEPVQVPTGVMRVLSERLAAQIDIAAAQVEPAQPVSMYWSGDLANKQRLIGELEKAFKITLDATAFESVRTVQDLAALIVQRIEARKATKKGRRYIIVYKDADGHVVETHVQARNHNEAVESLLAEGLAEVITVERADDEDDDTRYGRRIGNSWNGCVIPILLAAFVAAIVVGFVWLRHN